MDLKPVVVIAIFYRQFPTQSEQVEVFYLVRENGEDNHSMDENLRSRWIVSQLECASIESQDF